MSETCKPPQKEVKTNLLSSLFHAIVGVRNGVFEDGDGYRRTSAGLVFDADLWERAHPGKTWRHRPEDYFPPDSDRGNY